MTTLIWAVFGAVALVWPARLAGPLDGAPLDRPLEAAVIGAVLIALAWSFPRTLHQPLVRVAIVALLAWKAVTAATVAADGWCATFISPVPLYRATDRIPHSWDVRADWLATTPRCSAVMTQGYSELERFPVWFYNLPPANDTQSAQESDRPPNVTLRMTLDGFLRNAEAGVFQVRSGEDMATTADVDGVAVPAGMLASGLPLDPGVHHITLSSVLVRSHWRLEPVWQGRNLWSATTATMTPPSRLDAWLRPWGRFVPLLLVALMIFGAGLAPK